MDPQQPVRVIAVGGVDPGGGAGLLRDVLTGAALGVTVATVGTAWTEQEAARPPSGGGPVLGIEPRAAAAVSAALQSALRQHPTAAVKIGMVPDAAVAAAIVEALSAFAGLVVVDPVLASSSGGALWSGPLDGWWPLLRRATLVTPNAPELAALSGNAFATVDDAIAAAQVLRARGAAAVLVKGGHLAAEGDGATVTDVLVDAAGARRFSRPRVPGPSPRGTGCALSTAIAAALADGATLDAAVDGAARWLGGRIAARVRVGGQWFLP